MECVVKLPIPTIGRKTYHIQAKKIQGTTVILMMILNNEF